MSSKELIALIWDAEAGRVHCNQVGRLRFRYSDAWRQSNDALYLSLSMPLANAEHSHAPTDAFLWGLLPDNEVVLARWGQTFHVSPRNALALLSHVGEDCAGAVQFVRPDRLKAVLGAGPQDVVWLSDAEVAERLRALRADQAAWRSPRDTGQFSLAGAQPKTALIFQNGLFGVPAGRTPTTHILKPPNRDRPGHVENEHLCLTLARALGLDAARSEVRRFGEEIAVVVTRYDRVLTAELAGQAAVQATERATEAAAAATSKEPGAAARAALASAAAADAAGQARALTARAKVQPLLRLHQEDLCQAFGLPPASKYQSEGGPTPRRIVELLREHSSDPGADVAAFADALIFNWLIAGTDAHAKNYSMLHAAGGRVRLAPLYDLASALLYPDLDPSRIGLAMRIGAEYRIRDIARRQWIDCAKDLGLVETRLMERAVELATQFPDRVSEIARHTVGEGLDATVVAKLAELLTAHAGRCLKTLAG